MNQQEEGSYTPSILRQRFDPATDPMRIVVKFQDGFDLPYEDGAEAYLEGQELQAWLSLQQDYPELTLTRPYRSITPERVRELIARGVENDPTYEPVDLLAFYHVKIPPGIAPEWLAQQLSQLDSVETAYVYRPAPDPGANPPANSPLGNLGYLGAAPTGVDAAYARNFAGGDGSAAGLHFVDVERGWTLNHEDLMAHNIVVVDGPLLDAHRYHGTAVLGIVCALDNAVGGTGIAPNIAAASAVSYAAPSNLANAVVVATDTMNPGDVLLVEAQVVVDGATLFGPIECYYHDYENIRLATANGIIVVEAGGNGSNEWAPALDCDTYANSEGQVLVRNVRDSYAIIVSAATAQAPHTRLNYAPYGDRIDCYAWGEHIATARSNASGIQNAYWGFGNVPGFNGTSGAAAIIAGVALLVQSLRVSSGNGPFSPLELRELLADAQWGTAADPDGQGIDAIGVMPDLRNIIDNVL